MKRIIKWISFIIAAILCLFWTIGWFSVPKEDHKLILIVGALTEIVPVFLWILMRTLIKREQDKKELESTKKSVPIWERGFEKKDVKTESGKNTEGKKTEDKPPLQNPNNNADGRKGDGGKEETKEKEEGQEGVNAENANNPGETDVKDSVRSEIADSGSDSLFPDCTADSSVQAEPVGNDVPTDDNAKDAKEDDEEAFFVREEFFVPEQKEDIVPEQKEELRKYVDKAVSEASFIQGTLGALRVARASLPVTKAVMSLIALSCQEYESEHPMSSVLFLMTRGDFENRETVFLIRKKVEEYLLSTGTEDSSAELYGTLLGLEATDCPPATYKPYLKQCFDEGRFKQKELQGQNPLDAISELRANMRKKGLLQMLGFFSDSRDTH